MRSIWRSIHKTGICWQMVNSYKTTNKTAVQPSISGPFVDADRWTYPSHKYHYYTHVCSTKRLVPGSRTRFLLTHEGGFAEQIFWSFIKFYLMRVWIFPIINIKDEGHLEADKGFNQGITAWWRFPPTTDRNYKSFKSQSRYLLTDSIKTHFDLCSFAT